MNNLFTFTWQFLVCSVVLYAAYVLLWRKSSNFTFNRYYLLSIPIIAAILPLIKVPFIPVMESNFTMAMSNSALGFNMLPEIWVLSGEETTGAAGNHAFSLTELLLPVYLLGIFFAALVFLFKIREINNMVRLGRLKSHEEHIIVELPKGFASFSFMNYIFLAEEDRQDDTMRSVVLNHELAHIRQRHSWDIVYIEVIKMICWFNPVVHLIKHSLSDVHEYLADNEASNQLAVHQYSQLLASHTLAAQGFTLGAHFSQSQIVRRIVMLGKARENSTKKYWPVVPIVLSLFLVFSCSEEQEVFDQADAQQEVLLSADIPAEMKEKMNKMQQDNPTANFKYLEISADDEAINLEEKLKEIDMEGVLGKIRDATYFKERQRVGIIYDENNVDRALNIQEQQTYRGEEVFSVVEHQPEPVGGIGQYYEYVQKNLAYPEQAKSAGIEGKVYIQFIVTKDGSLEDVQVVKGIGGGCDEAALKVVEASDKWKAGMQRGQPVQVRMVVPISFKLS